MKQIGQEGSKRAPYSGARGDTEGPGCLKISFLSGTPGEADGVVQARKHDGEVTWKCQNLRAQRRKQCQL